MRMSNKCYITVAFVIIVCKNNIIKILLAFVNSVKLIAVKINQIHCIIKFFIKEVAIIFIKKFTLCNIQKEFKIPNKILHLMINSADISTLKYLAATANRKWFGVTLIIRLWTVIAHHIKMKRLFIINIRRKKHSFSVRVNTAYILSVNFNANFGSCFKWKPKFFSLKFLWNINISFNKRCSVRCEIHIALIKRAVIITVIFKFHFGYLARVPNHKIGNFPLWRIYISFKPTEAQISPLFRTHRTPYYFNMCHFYTSLNILKIRLFTNCINLNILFQIFFYLFFNPSGTAVQNKAFWTFAPKN